MSGKKQPQSFMIFIGIILLALLGSGAILIILGKDEAMARGESDINNNQEIKISVSSNLAKDPIGFSSEIIEITDDNGQNYFVNYRIKREQFRQEAKEMLKLLLESDIRKTREEAQTRWLELSNKISKEGEIENVLKMRGFRDVVSEVNGVKVTITILAATLKNQEIKYVQQIASDITGFPREKVEIVLRT